MDWGPYDELEEDQPPAAQSENTEKQATGVSRTTSTPKPRPKPLRRHELNGASEEHASRHASGGGMGGGPRVLEVHRDGGQWKAFYPGSDGTRRPARDIVIPPEVEERDLPGYIADLCHEWATLENNEVRILD